MLSKRLLASRGTGSRSTWGRRPVTERRQTTLPSCAPVELRRPEYFRGADRRSLSSSALANRGLEEHQLADVLRRDDAEHLVVPRHDDGRGLVLPEPAQRGLEHCPGSAVPKSRVHPVLDRSAVAGLGEATNQIGASQDSDRSMVLHHGEIVLEAGEGQLHGPGERPPGVRWP